MTNDASVSGDVAGEGKLNGVASLLLRVIEEKLEEGEVKRRIFDRLDLNVFVHVVDSGQSASVEFRPVDGAGTARVSSGRRGRPDLRVECDNATFIQFTMFSLVSLERIPGLSGFGLPNFFDDNGKEALRKLAKRQLRIQDMVRHSPGLVQFLRFLAIEDES